MFAPPDGFRHVTSITIRFSDLDALGHVNNATYLTYMETGRVQYYRDLGLWKPTPRLSGPIVAKATVEYKLPLTLEDDQIFVYTRCSRMGDKSYEIQHQIIRHRENRPDIAAYGLIVLVAFDYHIGKSIHVPEEWRSTIAAYEPSFNTIDSGL